MREVRVKICGITRKEDLTVAVDAGADAVGFLVGVPSSPRNLTLEKVKTLLDLVPVFVDSVVVTAPESVKDIVEICETLKPSVIQIHGKKKFVFSQVHEKVTDTCLVKTVYVKPDILEEENIEELKQFDAVLLDSFTKNQYGGTGKTHDWTVSQQIKEAVAPVPVILAGGLKPENVKEAILAVKPYAVDVASGVETSPGIKDHNKIHVFVENAKEIKLQK
ncbi:MAG: phosphoribosylanthranilate isomerase [Candidatus Bathyarchaeota archaeon]|nr:phosphoribosylanthranilate isomerase [Candidatus Bathyarchaeum tardum]WNZ30223.1 MAG: phosphoribosylanthranilate isomerase [Candidatus Bathyarchaeota archaeon]